jgi:hypothetical protein
MHKLLSCAVLIILGIKNCQADVLVYTAPTNQVRSLLILLPIRKFISYLTVLANRRVPIARS